MFVGTVEIVFFFHTQIYVMERNQEDTIYIKLKSFDKFLS